MLYQIICGSLKGTMILFGIISLAYVFVYELFFRVLPNKLRRFLNNRKIRTIASMCELVFVITSLILIGMLIYRNLLSRGEDEGKVSYVNNSIAIQKDINVLFVDDESDGNEMIKYLQKMHVRTDSEEKCISFEGLDYYYEVIEIIYKNGNEETKRQKRKDREIEKKREKLEKCTAQVSTEYLEEAVLWKQIFEDTRLPSDLYQYSRALKDAVEKGYEMEILEMLDTASEAIDRGEEFLRYDDRNINGKGKKMVINAEDMAFINGKIYYQLAERFANGTKEEREWVDPFWMLSYSCMCRAKNLINEDNVNYARVNYYLGNIGEHMLKRIPKKDDLYSFVGRQALSYYACAQKALEQRTDYYDVEESMRDNIRNGMETVKSLLEEK